MMNPFHVLDVSRRASREDIEEAYWKSLSRVNRNVDASPRDVERAREIERAYRQLTGKSHSLMIALQPTMPYSDDISLYLTINSLTPIDEGEARGIARYYFGQDVATESIDIIGFLHPQDAPDESGREVSPRRPSRLSDTLWRLVTFRWRR